MPKKNTIGASLPDMRIIAGPRKSRRIISNVLGNWERLAINAFLIVILIGFANLAYSPVHSTIKPMINMPILTAIGNSITE